MNLWFCAWNKIKGEVHWAAWQMAAEIFIVQSGG
jgi:hypothetical protein